MVTGVADSDTPVTVPLESTLATALLEELQLIVSPGKVEVQDNDTVSPVATVANPGEISISTTVT